MSLRKAPQLTPELLAAAHQNARHSTGPLSAAVNMLLRQEGALDRSIDRKVRILLRLRKESTKLPTAPAGQAEVSTIENTEEATYSDIMSYILQGLETVEDAKLNERRGNIYENKGSTFKIPHLTGNIIENKDSYHQDAGMLLKRQGVSFR
ncbi:MAG: hypothetical protein ACLQVM_21425 [Terriglobia bacterium]